MKLWIALFLGLMSAGSLLGGCTSSDQAVSTGTTQVASSPATSASTPPQIASSSVPPVVPVAPAAPMPPERPLSSAPTESREARSASSPQSDTPLNSDLAPVAFADTYAAQIRAAATSEALDALALKCKSDEAQFQQVADSRTAPNQLRPGVAATMTGAMRELQRAIAAKRMELSGQDPIVQAPYTTSDKGITLAQYLANQAQRMIENANDPALARQTPRRNAESYVAADGQLASAQ